ncbi:MAG: hypothetical protein KDC07_06985 [Chitinophagaceae bacterium]|nr:hypothetical protein [Chitinophagaceae bacterium]MCB9044966.1 hypothetical protein [Chitinophagales bacterium]
MSLFLFSTEAGAQHRNGRVFADSVLKVLPGIKNDTDKLYAYTLLIDQYNDINMDSSVYFTEKVLQHARKMNSKWAWSSACNTAGFTYYLDAQFDTALHYFKQAEAGYIKLKDTLRLAGVYHNMGDLYSQDDQLSTSLNYYLKALNAYESIHDDGIATLCTDIGDLYCTVDERDKARSYYDRALEANQKHGDKFDRAYIMMSLVEELIKDKKYDEAITYADSVVAIYTEFGNKFFIAIGQNYLAECYLQKKNYNKAMSLFRQAEEYFSIASDESYTAFSIAAIGTTYLRLAADTTGYKADATLFEPTRLGNYHKAVEYLNKARGYFEQVDDKPNLVDLYGKLSEASEALGKKEDALALYKLRAALKDSLDIQNESKKVAKLDAQKAMELKDKELELQNLLIAKKHNERIGLITGIVLLIVVSGIIFYNYRQRGISNQLLAAEKQKSEELLLNILPEEVAEELKEKGTANATHFDEVTVLFTDFVNFSRASERMDSQELVDELHTCFKAFDRITGNYQIEKIKTIGDAYLAVCGLPVADKHHAEKVVSAAVEILHFMNKRRQELGDKTFEIRIGIHSGDVVAGIVGVKKFAYDIWGDTVNTAARMEQNSEAGKINISQTTYDLVKDKFTCTYRGEHEAKNKGRLKMYFVEV